VHGVLAGIEVAGGLHPADVAPCQARLRRPGVTLALAVSAQPHAAPYAVAAGEDRAAQGVYTRGARGCDRRARGGAVGKPRRASRSGRGREDERSQDRGSCGQPDRHVLTLRQLTYPRTRPRTDAAGALAA
jgi:hypothetical protein